MVYADFDFYKDVFLGSLITEQKDFDRMILSASSKIDFFTANRAQRGFENPNIKENIQFCACALADLFFLNEGDISRIRNQNKISGESNIKSETLGQRSVTYKEGAKQTLKELQIELNSDVIRNIYEHLTWTGLLNRKVN